MYLLLYKHVVAVVVVVFVMQETICVFTTV